LLDWRDAERPGPGAPNFANQRDSLLLSVTPVARACSGWSGSTRKRADQQLERAIKNSIRFDLKQASIHWSKIKF
jgi:hypothetical protein